MKNKYNLKDFIELTVFCIIVILLAFTPIGYIPLATSFKITTIHIPVIISSILLGPKRGAIVGFTFGLTSFINNTFISPSLTSFVFTPFYENAFGKGNFWSLVICFIPRILTGITPYYFYKFMKIFNKSKENLSLALSGIVGSLTNTILVMSMIYIFFGREYALAKDGTLINLILYAIFINGFSELVVAGIIVTSICKILKKLNKF